MVDNVLPEVKSKLWLILARFFKVLKVSSDTEIALII
jgi:hypothetical protein